MRWYKEVLQMKMRKKNDTAVYSTGTKVIRFLGSSAHVVCGVPDAIPIFYVVLGAFKKNHGITYRRDQYFPI